MRFFSWLRTRARAGGMAGRPPAAPCRPRLEVLEDRCMPSCVSAFVAPSAPLGDPVTALVQSGLPGNGSPFGQTVSQDLAIGFGNSVPPLAKSC
jgi:hypothetical protein